jgi:hypothetical protein
MNRTGAVGQEGIAVAFIPDVYESDHGAAVDVELIRPA